MPEVTDPVSGKAVDPSHWGEIRLCWDRDTRRHSLHIAYECTEVRSGDPSVVVAVDEGVINSMALATPTGFRDATDADSGAVLPDTFSVLVVNGREGRSIKRQRNKTIGQLDRLISRTSPGSRRHRKLVLAKKKARGRAKRQLRDFDHQVSAKAAHFISSAGCGRVVVGDVRGIEQRSRSRGRANRHQRQQLSQWSRGRQESYLAHRTGIDLEHVTEAYTSQTCPACNSRNRPNGRRYSCGSCGFSANRDAVGATNIWRLAVMGAFVPLGPSIAISVTYRRAVVRWSPDQRRRARRSALNRAAERHALGVVCAAGTTSATTSSLTQELAELVEPLLVAA